MEHFLPWYFYYRDGTFSTTMSFYYRDQTFSTLISFYCLDATFSTLISFCRRDATFSTLISFYRRDATFSTLISFYAVIQHFLPWYHFKPWCNTFYLDIILSRDRTFSTLISVYCRDATFSILIYFILLSWCTRPWRTIFLLFFSLRSKRFQSSYCAKVFFFFLLSQLSSRTSRGNACYAG